MFRFTIRDVLWLTVVVAMVVVWWSQDRRVASAPALSMHGRYKR